MVVSSVKSRKWRLIVLYVIALTGGVFGIISWPGGIVLWLIIVGIGLFFLVRWHAQNSIYLCPNCGHTFVISTLTDFISPHFPNRKLLKCPQCNERSWCSEESPGQYRK
jgi:DNA-directed RNA polymerase subunit RPC12/RpoP